MFSENSAEYGGAVYVEDTFSSSVCESRYYTDHTESTECFLLACYKLDETHNLINFSGNSANIVGSAIFGGLLDRCTISPAYTDVFDSQNMNQHIYRLTFLMALSNLQSTEVASYPVRVCYCYNNNPDCNHDNIPFVTLQKGEKLYLPLVVVDQINHTISATIHTIISSNSYVGSIKQNYNINTCTNLSIRVFPESNQLELYAAGPCSSKGISKRMVKILILDCVCPIGFWPSVNEDFCDCICDPKLPKLIKSCVFQTASVIREDNF